MAKIQYWHTLERAKKVVDEFVKIEEKNEDIDIIFPVGVYLNGNDAGYTISLPNSVRIANVYGLGIVKTVVVEVGFKTDFHPKSNIALNQHVQRQFYNEGDEAYKRAAEFVYTWLRHSRLVGFQVIPTPVERDYVTSTGSCMSMPTNSPHVDFSFLK